MRRATFALLALAGWTGCDKIDSTTSVTPVPPATSSTPTNPDVKHDNTTTPSGTAKTPLDQLENKHDIKITADIRRQILDQKDMSVSGRNVKVITANGKVTLRGSVPSAAERDTIAKIATDVAGAGNVENQLQVDTK